MNHKSLQRSGFLVCLVLLFSILIYATAPLTKGKQYATIVFYNVENLFDTIDDPLKADEEFTPASEKRWDLIRFNEKLNRIASVIKGVGGDDLPAVIGLCEVENIQVLEGLVEELKLKAGRYEPVLIEGPDERGIDVALLYSKRKFKFEKAQAYRVQLEGEERPTRDILHVSGKLKKGPSLHIFVNHWPSRYGGAEITEPKRIAAAAVLGLKIDSLLKADPSANIICMGDFNDYPENKSVYEVLSAKRIDENGRLVNLMNGLAETKRGSYNYRGDWGFLDQIMVSPGLTDATWPDVLPDSTGPYFTPEMLYTDPKYGDEKPNRTYGGSEYFGGFSDHLPVYTVIRY